MKVLLADDHDLFRDGLRFLMQDMLDAQIFEARDYNEAHNICLQEQNIKLALIDLNMPGADDLSGILKIKNELPDNCYVAAISAIESSDIVSKLLDSGLRGFIPKSLPTTIISKAIELILSGGTYIPSILLSAIDSTGHKANDINITPEFDSIVTLTGREREVLGLLVKGGSNKSIARDLDISVATVSSHVVSIFRTLNVNNRTQASREAVKLGLV